MTSPVEVELKLELPAAALRQFRKLAWIRALAGMQHILANFQHRQIFIKDLTRGLIDFPAIMGGKEIFLCWESDEDDIEFWHDLETGYGGREKLE